MVKAIIHMITPELLEALQVEKLLLSQVVVPHLDLVQMLVVPFECLRFLPGSLDTNPQVVWFPIMVSIPMRTEKLRSFSVLDQ